MLRGHCALGHVASGFMIYVGGSLYKFKRCHMLLMTPCAAFFNVQGQPAVSSGVARAQAASPVFNAFANLGNTQQVKEFFYSAHLF